MADQSPDTASRGSAKAREADALPSLKAGLSGEVLTLTVDTLTGSQHSLLLPASSCVADLYSAVGDECGLEPENIALTLGTTEIPRSGSDSLASLGVCHGARLRLSPRLESGLFKIPPHNSLQEDMSKALQEAMSSVNPKDLLAQLLDGDGSRPATFELKLGGDSVKVEVSLTSEARKAKRAQEAQKTETAVPLHVLHERAVRGLLTDEERAQLQRHYCETIDRKKDNASLQTKLERLKQKRAQAKLKRRRGGPRQRSRDLTSKSLEPAVPKTKGVKGGGFLGLKRGFLL